MNAVDMAKKAYGASATPVRTPRNTEYALFANITRRLRAAASAGPQGFAAMALALHENRKLWSTLAVDVADAGNRLPDTLRGQIFYLSEFVNHHSSKVLKGQGSADALVEINTAVMRGLGQESGRQ